MNYSIEILEKEKQFLKMALSEWESSNFSEVKKDCQKRLDDLEECITILRMRMVKNKPNLTSPLREGLLKNNQLKPKPNIDKSAILKPPAAKPKKNSPNALLISKAPEMLEMLKELINANPIHISWHDKKIKAYKLIKEATEI